MSLFRPHTERQLAHTDPLCNSHLNDKIAGERRQELRYVRLPSAPSPSPVRDLSGLRQWRLRRDQNGNWARCIGNETYADYVKAEAKSRNWFWDQVKRKGGVRKMRRKAATPVEILVVSAAPWLSEWLARTLKEGGDPRPQIREVMAKWYEHVSRIFADKRFWIGLASHTDTSDWHMDILLSRYDGKGLKVGSPGLELAGPWTTAVDRHVRAGSAISEHKHCRMTANIARHRQRYGEGAIPLDVALSRALDECADQVIPGLAALKREYADQVPALEQAHLEKAAAEALAAAEYLSSLARECKQDHLPPVNDINPS